MAEAWVTLATNDSYALGALVLAESLKRVGTMKQLHILITPSVTAPIREQLAKFYNAVTDVDVLDSQDAANLALIKRPELGVTFTKLHCWTLTQYTKAVFLDADCLLLRNSDELFSYPELSAAPDIGWPDIFNSGVFVFVPSQQTFQALLQHAVERGSFDGGDQGLLNTYFHDWNSKGPSHRLPFIYNMSSHVVYTYVAAYKHFAETVKIVHFLGALKPWHHQFDVRSQRLSYNTDSQSHVEHVEFWWRLFAESVLPSIHPEISPAPNREESPAQLALVSSTSPPVVSQYFEGHHQPALPLPRDIQSVISQIYSEGRDQPAISEYQRRDEPAPPLPYDIPAADISPFEGHGEPAPPQPRDIQEDAMLVAAKVLHPAQRSVRPARHRLTFPLPLWLKQGGEGARVPPPLPSWRQTVFRPPKYSGCPVCDVRSPLARLDGYVVIDGPPEIKAGPALPTVPKHAHLVTARGDRRPQMVSASDSPEVAQRLGGGQVSEEEHRAAWEQGHIEYLGRDSWENIQKRLDESCE